ncbi:MDR family MFS transporter [Oharaeibacter diazotrophicus]|uniref:EmrB/QacA subfamily drug resistance transporter n=1 Tax=Oharaeibacter diazotrophicus TaxID=1920512 RepID=A0A4R6RDK9_9HYPH|nr:MDR family MFS transporter [Oharaeibacter diazotrophicus]TDP84270.1 EmrB/QacA subfamily drug resistance transporter [Oharaeibacter diazotrophicus]BBE73307.1 multidrug resistance protein 3 [Pleomorphomonas sp. SM30]GLS75098.1 MFS transporter [Oharaeibacter diazotrophicus]
MATTAPAAITEEDRRQIVIGALISMLLAALDQTIVAPALPTIGAVLGDAEWLPWVISAYFLTGTAVTPLYGKLADLKGRRPVLFAAVGIFLVGSVVCAAAPTMPVLVIGRAIQGLGGGGLIALAQTIIGDVVPPRERSRYMVYITGVWAFASLAGPVVGGFFAQHLSWTLIFWINLPIGAGALLLSERTLRKLPVVRRDHRLDLLGAALVVAATVALQLALTFGGRDLPWTSPEILGLFAAALALFVVFGVHLTRAPEPLVPPRVLANPVIATATFSLFFSSIAFVGLSVYFPIYLELVVGLGPASSGVALVAFLGGTVSGANLAGRIMRKSERYKRIAVAGSTLAVAMLVLLAVVAPTGSFVAVEILIALIGLGVGTQFPVTTVSVQNAAEQRDLGVATAALAFLRSLGSVIGVAVLGAVLISTGVAAAVGEGMHQAGGAAAGEAAAVFRWVFAVAAAAQAASLVLLLAMEEKPLRGHAGPPPVELE